MLVCRSLLYCIWLRYCLYITAKARAQPDVVAVEQALKRGGHIAEPVALRGAGGVMGALRDGQGKRG